MPNLTSTQRAHELLALLGENAPAWFEFDEQLVAFRAWDEFTVRGALVVRPTPAPLERPDAAGVLEELRRCLEGMLRDASGLNDVLRYSRVLDLVAMLHPVRAR
jgi:hypothetical protein